MVKILNDFYSYVFGVVGKVVSWLMVSDMTRTFANLVETRTLGFTIYLSILYAALAYKILIVMNHS